MTARRREVSKFIGIGEDIHIEGWIMFRNPVPMLYAWQHMEAKTRIAAFDDIEDMLNNR